VSGRHGVELVVGLGNPGPAYRNTRHNMGFRVVQHLALQVGACWRAGYLGRWCRAEIRGRPLLLLRPHTYMNDSGRSVAAVLCKYQLPPERILLIHDHLDLPLGRVRLRRGGGSGGHRGVESVQRELGAETMGLLRIGIGRPPHPGDVTDYVLSPFPPEQRPVVELVVSAAARAVSVLVDQGYEYAMDHFNGLDITGLDPGTG